MYDPKVHVGVSAMLIRYTQQWEVLMIKRGANATHGASTWALPGGWLDYGQTPEEAAARELYEECGVGMRPETGAIDAVVVNTYPEEGMHVVCVNVEFGHDQWVKDFEIENREPHKHDHVMWVCLDDLPNMDLFPATEAIAKHHRWV